MAARVTNRLDGQRRHRRFLPCHIRRRKSSWRIRVLKDRGDENPRISVCPKFKPQSVETCILSAAQGVTTEGNYVQRFFQHVYSRHANNSGLFAPPLCVALPLFPSQARGPKRGQNHLILLHFKASPVRSSSAHFPCPPFPFCKPNGTVIQSSWYLPTPARISSSTTLAPLPTPCGRCPVQNPRLEANRKRNTAPVGAC